MGSESLFLARTSLTSISIASIRGGDGHDKSFGASFAIHHAQSLIVVTLTHSPDLPIGNPVHLLNLL